MSSLVFRGLSFVIVVKTKSKSSSKSDNKSIPLPTRINTYFTFKFHYQWIPLLDSWKRGMRVLCNDAKILIRRKRAKSNGALRADTCHLQVCRLTELQMLHLHVLLLEGFPGSQCDSPFLRSVYLSFLLAHRFRLLAQLVCCWIWRAGKCL